MEFSIGEAAALCGVSLRTLRYYDRIGLVKPSRTADSGYRFYDAQGIALLQQVIFYRSLGLSLKEIAPLLTAPEQTRAAALAAHRQLLLLERQRLDGLIRLVEQTIGGTLMTKPEVTQKDVNEAKARYAQEARQKWGNTPEWAAFSSKKLSPQQEEQARREREELFSAFAALAAEGAEAAAPPAQALVARWQDHISRCYYPCSRETLEGLGKLYQCDSRFTAFLDGFGPGTAKLMSDAIAVFCKADPGSRS